MKKVLKKKQRLPARAKSQVALKRTVSVRRNPAELKHFSWDRVECEAVTPLLERQLIVGQQVMLARLLLRKGCIVPLHSHVNEQLSLIFEGALKFWIDDKEIIVRAGEVLTIPPNMPHKAEALEDTRGIDVFDPPRADWLNKTDSYLRK
ncbi:MAG TPA: cupin domain-containing protein [Terriglobales bacterium]|nr:cupin domain-containing protein [Terriglobales bacterium]